MTNCSCGGRMLLKFFVKCFCRVSVRKSVLVGFFSGWILL